MSPLGKDRIIHVPAQFPTKATSGAQRGKICRPRARLTGRLVARRLPFGGLRTP